MKKHEWNTGRRYDQHGQRMVAVVEKEWLVFTDVSRQIDGAIPLGMFLQGRELDRQTIEALVMTNYDYGNYSGSARRLVFEGESK